METAQQRKDKYEAKIDGRIIGQRYEDTKKLAVTKQGSVFKRQVEIEEKVNEYSTEHFGKPLCRKHQKSRG